MTPRPRCWQCRTILELDAGRPVGRSETCPECDADIRACRSCANWEASNRTCREPTAEVPADAERRNFCGAFQLAAPKTEEAAPKVEAASPDGRQLNAKERLEALFKR